MSYLDFIINLRPIKTSAPESQSLVIIGQVASISCLTSLPGPPSLFPCSLGSDLSLIDLESLPGEELVVTNSSDNMGGAVSREISINEEEGGPGIPRSATLPAGLKGLGEKFNFGTLPRGLGLDSSFTVKLTKSKKLDDTVNKEDLDETKVEIVKKEKAEDDEEKNEEETEESEETIQEFVEKLLIKLMEDALANIPHSKMKKSFTLPSGFRGLTKSHSFGKRIRQSIRVLVPAKKTVEAVTEEKTEEEKEEKDEDDEKGNEELSDTVNETKLSEASEGVEAEKTLNTTKNKTLPMSFKGFDLSAKKRQIQSNIKKLVSRTKKPKKETLEVINSILDDILREVEGEELELEEKKEEILKKEEEGKTESEEKVTDKEKQEETIEDTSEEKKDETVTEEEIPTGVLDKSND